MRCPNKYDVLCLYKGEKYNLQKFSKLWQPRTQEETFNCAYSSILYVIHLECGEKNEEFLYNMSLFLISSDCSDILTLHNYIKKKAYKKITFKEFDHHLNIIPKNFLTDVFLH